jgi:hypothetical protein
MNSINNDAQSPELGSASTAPAVLPLSGPQSESVEMNTDDDDAEKAPKKRKILMIDEGSVPVAAASLYYVEEG